MRVIKYVRFFLLLGLACLFTTIQLASQSTSKSIAFSSSRDGNSEIYVMNPDGTGQTRLTFNDAWDSLPSWSPNGNKIAFTSLRDGNFEICVMNPDSTGQTNLTNNPGSDSESCWSPDGNQIAFVSGRDNPNGDIFIMNADGTGQTNLTNSPVGIGNRFPSWSPDGTQIAFETGRDGNGEIYVMNVDGTGLTNLTNNPANDGDPDWSPGGTQIAFVSNRDGNDEIYVMNSNGTLQTPLTSFFSYVWQPSWSPNGRELVFSCDLNFDGYFNIYKMNSEGTELIRLTDSTDSSNYYPDWGKRLIRVPTDYPTIQAAIDAAYDGDLVLVADGTYTGEGNKDLDLLGKAITVKSENGPENCIIDCEGSGRGFVFYHHEVEESVVSGFTITNGYTSAGGGIYCENNSSPTIANCIISGNNALVFGGGIRCTENSSPTIINCTISGNNALGIPAYTGGGISCWESSPTITNCIISDNYGELGGGIYCGRSSPTITNCTIIGNNAADDGGGILCRESSPTITNCTIIGNNTLGLAGGIFGDSYSNPIVTNSILWGDTQREIYVWMINIAYCNIMGGYAGEGNIDADPLFVDVSDPDPSNWDLHLQSSSPCIDAGTNNVELPNSDFEGNPRIIDGDFDGYAVVDMGADEFVPGFTRPGNDITVTPAPGITVTFETVVDAGYTSCQTSSDNPAPDQEGICFLGTYYDINTTALYSGWITITLNYDEADIPANMEENDLKIYHVEGPAPWVWVDITYSINFDQNIIIGRMLDLSWFAIGIPNQSPIANAGDDQIDVPAGADCMASVTLNGSQSYDSDGDPLTYSWTWDSSSATGVNPTIQLPLGTHTISLVVNDGNADSEPDYVEITVLDDTPPTIQLHEPVCVNVGEDNMANKLTVSAEDNCSEEISPSIGKVEVYNKAGILVRGKGVYEISESDIYVYPNAEGWSIKVTATAIDENGNTSTQILSKSLIKCEE
jgi:TolB protein